MAEGLRGDPSGLSQTNINNETFAPSVLLFIPPLPPLSFFSLSLSLSFTAFMLTFLRSFSSLVVSSVVEQQQR